jgi:hypothetical protein
MLMEAPLSKASSVREPPGKIPAFGEFKEFNCKGYGSHKTIEKYNPTEIF